jgi:hypothetical protein
MVEAPTSRGIPMSNIHRMLIVHLVVSALVLGALTYIYVLA